MIYNIKPHLRGLLDNTAIVNSDRDAVNKPIIAIHSLSLSSNVTSDNTPTTANNRPIRKIKYFIIDINLVN